jgi:hypothetical protein
MYVVLFATYLANVVVSRMRHDWILTLWILFAAALTVLIIMLARERFRLTEALARANKKTTPTVLRLRVVDIPFTGETEHGADCGCYSCQSQGEPNWIQQDDPDWWPCTR